MKLFIGICLGLMLAVFVMLSCSSGNSADAQGTRAPRRTDQRAVETLNNWTVGLAGGQLEGAPIRFATEIARVVDDGDNLHVLPVVTRGPTENVEDLLYLRGIDVAVINTDALDQFRALIPNIQQRITYIVNLFPSELHIFVRPEIKSLSDLKGKKVNFNTARYRPPPALEASYLRQAETGCAKDVHSAPDRAGTSCCTGQGTTWRRRCSSYIETD